MTGPLWDLSPPSLQKVVSYSSRLHPKALGVVEVSATSAGILWIHPSVSPALGAAGCSVTSLLFTDLRRVVGHSICSGSGWS